MQGNAFSHLVHGNARNRVVRLAVDFAIHDNLHSRARYLIVGVCDSGRFKKPDPPHPSISDAFEQSFIFQLPDETANLGARPDVEGVADHSIARGNAVLSYNALDIIEYL